MSEEKKITGVATLLKTPEGEIKLPRTAAVLVQTSSGSSVELELAKKVNIEDYSKELSNVLDMLNEFSDTLEDFRYDIGTSANYTELAVLNREASLLIDDAKKALEDMEVFIVWEEKWEAIYDDIIEKLNVINSRLNLIENDIIGLTLRVRELEERDPSIVDVNLASMLASTDIFEMMLKNGMQVDENKLDNITNIYAELLKMEVKGINEIPNIIKERIVKQLLL